jgi:perosamine synthetase
LLRNHGDTGKYNHVTLGYNYRMTNIQGAIGLSQLKLLDEFNRRRIENAEYLNKNLKLDGITCPHKGARVKHVYNQYVVKVEPPCNREELMSYLQTKGVGSAVHYPKPIYQQPFYKKLGLEQDPCLVSEEVSKKVMSLPVHPSLKKEELEYIVETVNCYGGK